MTAATKQKPARTLSFNKVAGVLWLKTGNKEVGYYLDRIACQFGNAVAFTLTKIIPAGDEPRSYDVVLSPGCDQCECMGFLRRGDCKHVAALRCLKARGSV